MSKELLNEVYEGAFYDELQKIAEVNTNYADLAKLVQKAQQEEAELVALKKDFPSAYRKRDIGGAVGVGLGALGALAALRKRKMSKLDKGLISGLAGLSGLSLGMAGGHALAKAKDPEFAKRFSGASTEYIDAAADYARELDKNRKAKKLIGRI